ncbi:hypothetical protein NDI44_24680 [Trichocoleus sp. DQ-A3]|uniref:hypothetical protein n=1 Tax=Cyanophyceae TaxID=3028117 RepID=UPI0016873096|nr:hypothetical protein [Coleofasciculus sp. FACHB-125]MBD1899462.1 hypothetical protein [Coleofasciculus sp. FACHB-125]
MLGVFRRQQGLNDPLHLDQRFFQTVVSCERTPQAILRDRLAFPVPESDVQSHQIEFDNRPDIVDQWQYERAGPHQFLRWVPVTYPDIAVLGAETNCTAR